MTDDPIVEEVRKAGQAYIDSFGGDLAAVVADLLRPTEEARRAGRKMVALSPRQVGPSAQPTQSGSAAGYADVRVHASTSRQPMREPASAEPTRSRGISRGKPMTSPRTRRVCAACE